ncbi:MAG: HlyD family efflux transporter periplasmic adaptor subunit [Pseudomonas aeruginosa]|uniref:HlyD family efflux transporter periplasmic adaptor subunit n=2 Tax=Gammaproteobacteria TaxID=1236 RepID=UPI000691AB6A|nr:HlyD family efflux transporter periplasmic adaptor subunit [Pseudomonas aeruginosa]AYW66782.1 HlyD family efflux transporter periplasmic adaptor subunit [Pseudomonas aeruginosa]EKW6683302.1 HlyD family efflux transporter periplasmic adaptor subunit [Pseudomonas aeruginosa]MBG4646263.1 HlyD family efflux transporter periplasmic adaptor subunit [Pseudomonas aeruginosa]MBG5731893.1 HlyD family efflux transporter periplasmic adaptor subunit [Pseudomonas aeruginosa]MDU1800494.1 HlyD family efflu
MKKRVIAGVVALALVGAGVWWMTRSTVPDDALVLYGNVDVRQVSLAFGGSERIHELRAEEGDRVQPGQVLAVLDTRTLALQVEQARAAVEAQEQALLRLRNGSRPEEVGQAQARAEAAAADTVLAQQELNRLRNIAQDTDGRAVSRQELEQAAARLRVALAQKQDASKALELTRLGPRDEDIAEAEALLRATRVELALLEHRLAQAELKAPAAAVIRSRLLEVGDMASPQKPVFALALADPKWIRAYITEPQLGHVRAGMPARVSTDSHPDQAIDGTVGYISSVAEFTPKSVQTEELRTSLVYEIRVRVRDTDDRLRLGMPATVTLALDAPRGRHP